MTDEAVEELRPIPVRDLPERLGLSRSRVFGLLADLAIERVTDEEGRTCISGEDVLLLEQAIAFSRRGGTVADFKASRGMAPMPVEESALAHRSTQSCGAPQDRQDQLLMAVLGLLQQQQNALPQASVAAELDILQKRLDILKTLADGGMALSNNELADVLDLSPATLRGRGNSFPAYGLRFERETQGRSVSWRVVRPV